MRDERLGTEHEANRARARSSHTEAPLLLSWCAVGCCSRTIRPECHCIPFLHLDAIGVQRLGGTFLTCTGRCSLAGCSSLSSGGRGGGGSDGGTTGGGGCSGGAVRFGGVRHEEQRRGRGGSRSESSSEPWAILRDLEVSAGPRTRYGYFAV